MKRTRLGFLIFLFIIVFIILYSRIFFITFFPDARLKIDISSDILRGNIYDTKGNDLAISVDAYSLYIRPNILNDETRNILFNFLYKNKIITANEIEKFDNSKSFVWIKRKFDNNLYIILNNFINELKNKKYIFSDEVGIIKEKGRYYVHESLSQIVGITGIDNDGLFGIEKVFNLNLINKDNIYLTIDLEISKIAYEEIKKGVIENDAECGSFVLIDSLNNEILTIVSYPTFNPNDYSSINEKNIRSQALSRIYEPGSAMKIFSSAYAVWKNYLSFDSPIYYCGGSIEIGNHRLKCTGKHGYVTLSRIIQKSCNVGMVQVADKFNNTDFYKFLSLFGFGKIPEISLTDLEKGIFRNPENWSYLSKYMISIGQEIGVTTLQLAVAANVIANNGWFIYPKIVKFIENNNHKIIISANESNKVLPENITKKMLYVMKNVVSEDGTAIRAKIEGIEISGKTGTGQIAKEGGKGYYDDLYNAVFIAFIPSEKPVYTAVVSIHSPKGTKHTGGEVAAPIFSNIFRRLLVNGNLVYLYKN